MRRKGQRKGLWLPAILLLSSTGCFSGSLATNTGHVRGGLWSVDPVQYVHQGETARFSFVLKRPLAAESISALGLADYCIFDIGGDADAAGLDIDGAFTYEHTFDDVRLDHPILATATAFRLVGTRDRMKIAGEWVRNESPYDEPDVRVASASLRLIPYQAEVLIEVPQDWNLYDLDNAVLTLYRDGDEKQTRILRRQGGTPGFDIEGTDDGAQRITYAPKWDEINTTAPTKAVLTVFDDAGEEHQLIQDVITP